jgi:hypothetical protein
MCHVYVDTGLVPGEEKQTVRAVADYSWRHGRTVPEGQGCGQPLYPDDLERRAAWRGVTPTPIKAEGWHRLRYRSA